MSEALALLGGRPVRERPFPPRITMRAEEKQAVADVMDTDVLSGFYGSPGARFLGGPQVRAFEEEWAARFGYRHAVSMNSWSSGLMASIAALELEPGDEMVCSPFTMSASATSALFYGVLPVFADIDPHTFTLDPAAFEKAITPRTRAVMVVHLFGLPADMSGIEAVARAHGIRVIEDAAQAPLATYDGRPVGALCDIGGFSLNYHKHIHTGEGGMVVTDDDGLALRCQLVRNHGENAADALGVTDSVNVMGGNFRLTELQAAIGRVQLTRLDGILEHRRSLARDLAAQLAGVDGVTVPETPPGREHSHYVQPLLYDAAVTGIPRKLFVEAVAAELPPATMADDIVLSEGYLRPLYTNPIYQRRVAIGAKGYPFTEGDVAADRYAPGACPVAEEMHDARMLITYLVREPLSTEDLADFTRAIGKVVANASQLVNAAANR